MLKRRNLATDIKKLKEEEKLMEANKWQLNSLKK